MPPTTTTAADMETVIANMTLVDWLDDLTVRFLLNLPPAELSSVPRLCFQVEEAQWFYEDFIRPANPALPSLNLRQFCLTLFQHCPLLSGFNAAQHIAAYEEFLAYKVRVPVRGAILMDDSMEKVLLVRGWKKGASWSFPRGKINKNEPDLDCAIREVYEETGYDVSAAGLVDANRQEDGQVKAIDVIMREQHMKLFVFRGVPLDTYFEPRTRKEISKIQWYNIKDLPGFKKQKGGLAGQGTGEAQTAKFYMVAPFLGHLKKFINLQRRNTAANAQAKASHDRNSSGGIDGFQSTVTDTEDGEAFGGFKSELARETRSADDLKRLLSIGGPSAQPAEPSSGGSALLAMLKGGNTNGPVPTNFDPRTPFEQIDSPFPSQTPATPQPHHPQHPQNRAADVQNPQFGYSPQRLQQLQQPQRNFSVPNQPGFGGYMNGPPAQQHQIPPHMQQHMFHQEQQRQHSMPDFPLIPQQQQHHHHHHQMQHQQQYPAPRPTSNQQMSLLQAFHSPGRPQPPTASSRPVSQGFPPIGSEPAVPEASRLPPPRLNAHSMNLLNAFKGSNGSKQSGNNQARPSGQSGPSFNGQNNQHVGGQQQSALLDLFRKPSQPSPQPFQPVETAAVPPVASPTLSDATITGRRSTANEITRTLPPKAKAKAPQPKPAHQSYDGSSHENNTERKHSNGQTHAPTITRNQRASSKAKSRPEQQIPQFSILQRPGSSAGKPPPAPQSPLRFEASNSSQASFQPQVLKRPTSAEVPAHETTMKNDNLLNLFNKTDINAPPPAPQSAASPVQSSHSGAQAQQRNNSLLDLLNGRNTPPVLKTPEPPPAPQLPPERKTSQHGNTLHQQKQSNHLLHLFTKPGALQKSTGSPGTPISPFTLGTPATHKPREASFSEQSRETSRSRIGSMTSVRSGMSSGQQTPTEAKDMMLGYLNGVLQKEGLRGSGKKG